MITMQKELKPSEQFFKILDDDSYGIFPAPTDDRLAIKVLIEYLLGEDWAVTDPMNNEQVNTYAVHAVLMKHSRKYRKDWERRKRMKLILNKIKSEFLFK